MQPPQARTSRTPMPARIHWLATATAWPPSSPLVGLVQPSRAATASPARRHGRQHRAAAAARPRPRQAVALPARAAAGPSP